MNRGICQGAVLPNRGGLQVGRSQIGQRIAAGIVVIVVPADKSAQLEDRVIADDARISGRNIEGPDLRALVGVAHIAEDRVRGRAAA